MEKINKIKAFCIESFKKEFYLLKSTKENTIYLETDDNFWSFFVEKGLETMHKIHLFFNHGDDSSFVVNEESDFSIIYHYKYGYIKRI